MSAPAFLGLVVLITLMAAWYSSSGLLAKLLRPTETEDAKTITTRIEMKARQLYPYITSFEVATEHVKYKKHPPSSRYTGSTPWTAILWDREYEEALALSGACYSRIEALRELEASMDEDLQRRARK